MQCPYCKEYRRDQVIDSRATESGTVIRRRRRCLACGKRFTTYERIEEGSRLLVIKKDGRREPYEREKVLGALQRACWKRPLSTAQLGALVDELEEEVFRTFDREVPSRYIGNALAVRLRKLDQIAYLRFASMYHEFKVVDDFIQEAQEILERDRKDVEGQQDLFND
jgi:transcriptional repressor NrdR